MNAFNAKGWLAAYRQLGGSIDVQGPALIAAYPIDGDRDRHRIRTGLLDVLGRDPDRAAAVRDVILSRP